MAIYTVRFYNETIGEVFTAWEMKRYRFTAEDYKNIVTELFTTSCVDGIKAESLRADVFVNCPIDDMDKITVSRRCDLDPRHVFRVSCNSYVDGATINASILINGRYVRTMNIAS